MDFEWKMSWERGGGSSVAFPMALSVVGDLMSSSQRRNPSLVS
jgi:hypothetical protein